MKSSAKRHLCQHLHSVRSERPLSMCGVAKGEEIGRGVCAHVPMHHKSSVGVSSVLSIRRWGCVSHSASDSLVMKWENASDIACFCKWRRRNGRALRSLTVGGMEEVATPSEGCSMGTGRALFYH